MDNNFDNHDPNNSDNQEKEKINQVTEQSVADSEDELAGKLIDKKYSEDLAALKQKLKIKSKKRAS